MSLSEGTVTRVLEAMPPVPHKLYDWHDRIKAVERELPAGEILRYPDAKGDR